MVPSCASARFCTTHAPSSRYLPRGLLVVCLWVYTHHRYLRPKRTVFDLKSNATVMGDCYFSIAIFIQALNGAGSIAELVEKWGQMGSNAKRIADLRRLLKTLSEERQAKRLVEMKSGDYIAFDQVGVV